MLKLSNTLLFRDQTWNCPKRISLLAYKKQLIGMDSDRSVAKTRQFSNLSKDGRSAQSNDAKPPIWSIKPISLPRPRLLG